MEIEAARDDVPAAERAHMAVITQSVTVKNLEGELIDLQAAATSMAESALNKSCICKKLEKATTKIWFSIPNPIKGSLSLFGEFKRSKFHRFTVQYEQTPVNMVSRETRDV